MNRRAFLTAAGSAPLIVPRRAFGANDRIQVGFIGAGGRGRWLLNYFPADTPQAEVVALADCYLPRCYWKDPGRKEVPHADVERWSKYQDYRKMFDNEKLDAV